MEAEALIALLQTMVWFAFCAGLVGALLGHAFMNMVGDLVASLTRKRKMTPGVLVAMAKAMRQRASQLEINAEKLRAAKG